MNPAEPAKISKVKDDKLISDLKSIKKQVDDIGLEKFKNHEISARLYSRYSKLTQDVIEDLTS